MLVVGHQQPRAAHRDAARVGQLAGRDDLGAVAAVEGEALDAVVAGVGDVDRVARDGQAAAGRGRVAAAGAEAELADRAAGPAPRVQQRTVGVEAVDAVGAIGHQQRVVARDRDRADRAELPRLGAGDADLAAEDAVGPEDLDDVRGLVGDVDRAVGSDRHGLREAHHALGALADLARRVVRACRRRRAGAIGLGGGRAESGGGEGNARDERTELDRQMGHHPILNTRRARSRASGVILQAGGEARGRWQA